MRKQGIFAITTLALASVALMGAGSCVPGLGKSGSASTPVAAALGAATLSQCPSFALYQASVDSILQHQCMACHAAGGSGSAHFQLVSGDSADDHVVSTNFLATRDEAVPISNGSTSVSTGDPGSSSPLLERLNGTLSHDLRLNVASDDFQNLAAWVIQEASSPCRIDTNTGSVTVLSPSGN